MQNVKFFKKFLLPCGLCSAVPVVKSLPPSMDDPIVPREQSGKPVRPSELPIYSSEPSSEVTPCPELPPPGVLEQNVSQVRKSIQGIMREYKSSVNRISVFFQTGRDHSQVLLDYLQDDSNVVPKVGAIGIGGLTGLILGLRGGAIKRLVYTSTGAAAVASMCYPNQARRGYDVAKHYANIVYNFVYGVTPEDEKFDIKMPTFHVPDTISEFLNTIIQNSTAVASNVGSLIGVKEKNTREENPPVSNTKPKQD